MAKQGKKPPLLSDDDRTAERNHIKGFVLAGNRELGGKYGVGYAEAFHCIGARRPRVDDYWKRNAVPLKQSSVGGTEFSPIHLPASTLAR